MPRLKPDTQLARREHILEAAELCFARSGFHRTTMQDICREAGISPGALYVYFASKEDLIAGIAERDRNELARRLAPLADAPDFMAALQAVGERYFVEEPAHKRLMCIEIGVESTRNPKVGQIFRAVDQFVLQSFERLFQRLIEEGRIAPRLPVPELARAFMLVGDGLFWRRATDPSFDGKVMLPAAIAMITTIINPVQPASQTGAVEAAS